MSLEFRHEFAATWVTLTAFLVEKSTGNDVVEAQNDLARRRRRVNRFRRNLPEREFGENAGKGLDVAGSNFRHGPKNKIVVRFIAIAAPA
ncbi:hypothetical protein [Bradyrhizobium canariense]|uniref:hypothetical protein n=1 Tax=Bradyrhizobium canariense TaxID=255045 RepID=UPI001177BFED|nr:hypothetical protein [Bradyrhizobium canariense]